MKRRNSVPSPFILHSQFCTLHSALYRSRRDSGQGIVFAAATLVLLIGFVALVLNLGRVIERRTQMQLAADSAAYSGVMIEADTLSAIGWINSIMAQVHYNALKYAVDLNIAAVAAELEMRQNIANGPAVSALKDAYTRASTNLPLAKQWMVRLSQVENSLAILAPRLIQEEMMAVASHAGAERYSLYPGSRMFPFSGKDVSYRIEQFENGWRITNILGGDQDSLFVYLIGAEWHIEYSREGLTQQEIVIEQISEVEWRITYYEPPGVPRQYVYLKWTEEDGWSAGTKTMDPGAGITDPPEIQIVPWDADGDGIKEGMKITIDGKSQVARTDEHGNLYVWDENLQQYILIMSDTLIIEGVEVQLNASNRIDFDGGSILVGDPVSGNPTTLTIGRAHIVLSDPPVITTGIGEINISIRGFTADAFTISIREFTIGPANANGQWRKYYNSREEYWWRHRLKPQQPTPPALAQWQYDYQRIGALLEYEANYDRFLDHVFGDRLLGQAAEDGGRENWPEWTQWFDAIAGRPFKLVAPGLGSFEEPRIERPDGSWYYRIREDAMAQLDPETTDYYYQTVYNCPVCDGLGGEFVTGDEGTLWNPCDACRGLDWDRDDRTDLRVFAAEIRSDLALSRLVGADNLAAWRDYLETKMFRAGYGEVKARLPLVLAEEFFKYGLNLGVWREKDNPMLFPEDRQPNWGVVALSCARVGIKAPDYTSDYLCHFSSKGEREVWCNESRWNLYTGDLSGRLYPSKYQVRQYDLDEDILMGVSLGAPESPVAYLWDALLGARQVNSTLVWIDKYDGRGDPSVSSALLHMRNRQGKDFDYRSEEIEDVVAH
jgi:hypothetical protein